MFPGSVIKFPKQSITKVEARGRGSSIVPGLFIVKHCYILDVIERLAGYAGRGAAEREVRPPPPHSKTRPTALTSATLQVCELQLRRRRQGTQQKEAQRQRVRRGRVSAPPDAENPHSSALCPVIARTSTSRAGFVVVVGACLQRYRA